MSDAQEGTSKGRELMNRAEKQVDAATRDEAVEQLRQVFTEYFGHEDYDFDTTAEQLVRVSDGQPSVWRVRGEAREIGIYEHRYPRGRVARANDVQ